MNDFAEGLTPRPAPARPTIDERSAARLRDVFADEQRAGLRLSVHGRIGALLGAVMWGLGVLWIVSLPDTVIALPDGASAEVVMRTILQPAFVDLGVRLQEVAALIIVGGAAVGGGDPFAPSDPALGPVRTRARKSGAPFRAWHGDASEDFGAGAFLLRQSRRA